MANRIQWGFIAASILLFLAAGIFLGTGWWKSRSTFPAGSAALRASPTPPQQCVSIRVDQATLAKGSISVGVVMTGHSPEMDHVIESITATIRGDLSAWLVVIGADGAKRQALAPHLSRNPGSMSHPSAISVQVVGRLADGTTAYRTEVYILAQPVQDASFVSVDVLKLKELVMSVRQDLIVCAEPAADLPILNTEERLSE